MTGYECPQSGELDPEIELPLMAESRQMPMARFDPFQTLRLPQSGRSNRAQQTVAAVDESDRVAARDSDHSTFQEISPTPEAPSV